MEQIFPHSSQKEPTLQTPSSWTSSLHKWNNKFLLFKPLQIRSAAHSCPTLCDPMNRNTPGLPVHHQLLEFTQTHVHRVGDAIQPSHCLSFPSPPAPNPSQHQSFFQWVNSSHEVAKVMEFDVNRAQNYWHVSLFFLKCIFPEIHLVTYTLNIHMHVYR